MALYNPISPKKSFDFLIVGAGLYGAVFANRIAHIGKRCLVIDKRPHLGGNVYCEKNAGINVHRYGAHIFHTDNEEIWNFVNHFADFNHFENTPLANYKGRIFNLPFNMHTFQQMWGVKTPEEAETIINRQRSLHKYSTPANLEEQALSMVGEDIYYTLIKGYSEKQWGRKATDIPAFVIKRIPLRFTFDNNYFNDRYQGIPVDGYNQLITQLLKDIQVRLNTDYFENKSYFNSIADEVLFTGCIDEFFDYEFGKLDYRSLRFEDEYIETPKFQNAAVVNFTHKEISHTRIIEHKHFENRKCPYTIITREYPTVFNGENEPYYPVNNSLNNQLLKEYQEKSRLFPQYHFGGRLGHYKYYNMDEVVEKALDHALQVIYQDAGKAKIF